MKTPPLSPVAAVHGTQAAASSRHAAGRQDAGHAADAFSALLDSLSLATPGGDETAGTPSLHGGGKDTDTDKDGPAAAGGHGRRALHPDPHADPALAALLAPAAAALPAPLPPTASRPTATTAATATTATPDAHAAHAKPATSEANVGATNPADATGAHARESASPSVAAQPDALPQAGPGKALSTPDAPQLALQQDAPAIATDSQKAPVQLVEAAALPRALAGPSTSQPEALPLAAAALAFTPAAADNTQPLHEATLAAHPSESAFAGELSAQVHVMLEGGVHSARLELNPPELGPIRIELSLNGASADISFAATHAATREGIAQALPQLRELLAQQGLQLADAGISSGTGQGGAQQQQQEQAAAQRSGPQRLGRDPATAPAGPAPVALRARTARGALDLYA